MYVRYEHYLNLVELTSQITFNMTSKRLGNVVQVTGNERQGGEQTLAHRYMFRERERSYTSPFPGANTDRIKEILSTRSTTDQQNASSPSKLFDYG